MKNKQIRMKKKQQKIMLHVLSSLFLALDLHIVSAILF